MKVGLILAKICAVAHGATEVVKGSFSFTADTCTPFTSTGAKTAIQTKIKAYDSSMLTVTVGSVTNCTVSFTSTVTAGFRTSVQTSLTAVTPSTIKADMQAIAKDYPTIDATVTSASAITAATYTGGSITFTVPANCDTYKTTWKTPLQDEIISQIYDAAQSVTIQSVSCSGQTATVTFSVAAKSGKTASDVTSAISSLTSSKVIAIGSDAAETALTSSVAGRSPNSAILAFAFAFETTHATACTSLQSSATDQDAFGKALAARSSDVAWCHLTNVNCATNIGGTIIMTCVAASGKTAANVDTGMTAITAANLQTDLRSIGTAWSTGTVGTIMDKTQASVVAVFKVTTGSAAACTTLASATTQEALVSQLQINKIVLPPTNAVIKHLLKEWVQCNAAVGWFAIRAIGKDGKTATEVKTELSTGTGFTTGSILGVLQSNEVDTSSTTPKLFNSATVDTVPKDLNLQDYFLKFTVNAGKCAAAKAAGNNNAIGTQLHSLALPAKLDLVRVTHFDCDGDVVKLSIHGGHGTETVTNIDTEMAKVVAMASAPAKLKLADPTNFGPAVTQSSNGVKLTSGYVYNEVTFSTAADCTKAATTDSAAIQSAYGQYYAMFASPAIEFGYVDWLDCDGAKAHFVTQPVRGPSVTSDNRIADSTAAKVTKYMRMALADNKANTATSGSVNTSTVGNYDVSGTFTYDSNKCSESKASTSVMSKLGAGVAGLSSTVASASTSVSSCSGTVANVAFTAMAATGSTKAQAATALAGVTAATMKTTVINAIKEGSMAIVSTSQRITATAPTTMKGDFTFTSNNCAKYQETANKASIITKLKARTPSAEQYWVDSVTCTRRLGKQDRRLTTQTGKISFTVLPKGTATVADLKIEWEAVSTAMLTSDMTAVLSGVPGNTVTATTKIIGIEIATTSTTQDKTTHWVVGSLTVTCPSATDCDLIKSTAGVKGVRRMLQTATESSVDYHNVIAQMSTGTLTTKISYTISVLAAPFSVANNLNKVTPAEWKTKIINAMTTEGLLHVGVTSVTTEDAVVHAKYDQYSSLATSPSSLTLIVALGIFRLVCW